MAVNPRPPASSGGCPLGGSSHRQRQRLPPWRIQPTTDPRPLASSGSYPLGIHANEQMDFEA
ncbi:hypothetical protein E2562_017827 [Oryza meyeriana var. granulata]|uniref:Uncharacterized protein n=1 Tax=Oryza meyeriana var. granulata TaxID=110450 RepID=A0A6G1DXZ7_9ORYZ|nr:hypothetical protein E2562_017827 [Oryza meyeriana var. granulata]